MVVMDDAQSEGLAVITEAKYGFTVRDGVVGVTLLRSALVTDADLHPKIRETPDRPKYSDIGPHRIELALGRFAADLPVSVQPAALADIVFTPCIPYHGLPVHAGLLAVEDAPSFVPSWAEPMPDGRWTLRLHETLGRNGIARIRIAAGWKAAVIPLGGGKPYGPDGEVEWTGETLKVPFVAYQVRSVAFFPPNDSPRDRIELLKTA
jgi:alpha-mannosidase